jgi:hypothetical protein
MSFLAPLYLLGGLAISLPLLLHLIRRTPRGQQTFSSLMFLSPSPPRITRRSRIEHWLLLALRALAIGLLALAFSRPFLRASASLLMDRGVGRQVAILIDTSASMRRGNVWSQAVARAEKVLAALGPNDTAALYRFDEDVQKLIDFPDQTVDPLAHRSLVRQSLQRVSPTWRATRLDRALTTVADSLAAARRDRGGEHTAQMVVVSDLQRGSDLSGLQGYEWPREVTIQFESIQPDSIGNAAPRLLRNTAETDLRARVMNADDSKVEEFQIGWSGPDGQLLAASPIYVPAGQSRVIKLAERPSTADRLRLVGDSHDFDNDFFVGPEIQRQLRVIQLGDESADDPRGLRYFLDRVWSETPRRKVTITDVTAQQPLQILPGQRPDLIVASTVAESHQTALQSYLESGGAALFVTADPDSNKSILRGLPGVELVSLNAAEAEAPETPPKTAADSPTFALLSEIDFSHPIFATFADPRFADFTKVRFWNHQKFHVKPDAKARVFARFDDGAPALWEQPIGSGRAFVFASSWRPSDSQLALSSKFVPLLSSVLNLAAGIDRESSASLVVGDPLSLNTTTGEPASVVTPKGTEVKLDSGEKQFTGVDQPGTYQIKLPRNSQTVAVNLSVAESETAPLGVDQLEQLGVRIRSLPNKTDLAERERQMRDIELESRQKLWQWLIVAVIAVLGVETTLAGRAARKQETVISH